MKLSSLTRLLNLTFNTFADCRVIDIKRLTELEDNCDDVAISLRLSLYGKTEPIEVKIVKGFVYWEDEELIRENPNYLHYHYSLAEIFSHDSKSEIFSRKCSDEFLENLKNKQAENK